VIVIITLSIAAAFIATHRGIVQSIVSAFDLIPQS
jgi:hypothetical protein